MDMCSGLSSARQQVKKCENVTVWGDRRKEKATDSQTDRYMKQTRQQLKGNMKPTKQKERHGGKKTK